MGAAPRHIWFLVARWAVILGVAGIGIGLAAALALTRSLRPQLWGVEPTDPATYLIVAGVLLLVVLLAALLPARRAIAVDPVAALRSD